MARIKAITIASKNKNLSDPDVIYCGQSASEANAARDSAGAAGYVAAGVIMHGQTIGNRFFEVAGPPKAEAVEAANTTTRKKRASRDD